MRSPVKNLAIVMCACYVRDCQNGNLFLFINFSCHLRYLSSDAKGEPTLTRAFTVSYDLTTNDGTSVSVPNSGVTDEYSYAYATTSPFATKTRIGLSNIYAESGNGSSSEHVRNDNGPPGTNKSPTEEECKINESSDDRPVSVIYARPSKKASITPNVKEENSLCYASVELQPLATDGNNELTTTGHDPCNETEWVDNVAYSSYDNGLQGSRKSSTEEEPKVNESSNDRPVSAIYARPSKKAFKTPNVVQSQPLATDGSDEMTATGDDEPCNKTEWIDNVAYSSFEVDSSKRNSGWTENDIYAKSEP